MFCKVICLRVYQCIILLYILTNFTRLIFMCINTIGKRREIWIKPISAYEDIQNINSFNDLLTILRALWSVLPTDPFYPAILYHYWLKCRDISTLWYQIEVYSISAGIFWSKSGTEYIGITKHPPWFILMGFYPCKLCLKIIFLSILRVP